MSEVQRCVQALRQGSVVASPTDTCYGLLADPFSAAALARLCQLKQSDSARPWPLLLPKGYSLERIGCALSPAANQLARRFWPGKVTLVVACAGVLAARVGREYDGAVGLRIPEGPAVLSELLRQWDGPLTGTSANPQGRPPALQAVEVEGYFAGQLGCVLSGSAPGGSPSTVVDTVADPVRIVREGAVAAEAIFAEMAP